MLKKLLFVFFIFTLFLFWGCESALHRDNSSYILSNINSPRPSFDELRKSMESIKLLNCVAQYKSWQYSDQNGSSILDSVWQKRLAKRVSIENETSSGTATLIYTDSERIAVLSCAHIVNYPDTIITYYSVSGHIEKIRIRQSIKMYITDFNGIDYFDILAMDIKNDLVILGKNYHNNISISPLTLTLAHGKNKKLKWGDFAYLIGYPKGNLMVTSGLISLKPNDPRGNFLVDAPFNRGFSGGLVIHFNSNTQQFEWVGICYSVSADYQTFLIPETLPGNEIYSQDKPYTGQIYPKYTGIINYGITNVISMETIHTFIEKYKTDLSKQGYSLTSFIQNF